MITIPINISSTYDIGTYSNIHDKNNEDFKSGKFIFELHHEKTCFFAYAKIKAQICRTLTAHLISAFGFCYIDSTIPLLPKYEVSIIQPFSVVVQPGLCRI